MASIRQRNGRYQVMWCDNDDVQRSVTYDTKREAAAGKKQAEKGLIVGKGKPAAVRPTARKGKITIAGYAPTFLAEHGYAESTLVNLTCVINKHLVSNLGHRTMESITSADVRRFHREMEAEHSGCLIRRVAYVASSMWQDAMDADIVESNPWPGHRIKQETRETFSTHGHRLSCRARTRSAVHGWHRRRTGSASTPAARSRQPGHRLHAPFDSGSQGRAQQGWRSVQHDL